MSSTYHDPISFSAPASSAVVNAPLAQLDQALIDQDTRLIALEGYPTGASSFTQLNLGATSTLTIASGAVTISRSRHRIDTESAAATDDLVTISGAADGDVLVIQSVSAARLVVIKHNTGNIYNASGNDITLESPNQQVRFVYDATNARWNTDYAGEISKLSEETDDTEVLASNIRVQDNVLAAIGDGVYRLDFVPTMLARKRITWQALGASTWWGADGSIAPTSSGTITASSEAESYFINCATIATINSTAGAISTTFNFVNAGYDPVLECVLKTPSNISSIRFLVGFVSAALTADVNTALSSIFLRYSTNIPDAGWIGVQTNASAGSTTTALSAVAVDTVYRLRIRVDSANATSYFSVNGSAEVALTGTFPTTTANMGIIFRVMNLTGSIRSLKFSRLACYHN